MVVFRTLTAREPLASTVPNPWSKLTLVAPDVFQPSVTAPPEETTADVAPVPVWRVALGGYTFVAVVVSAGLVSTLEVVVSVVGATFTGSVVVVGETEVVVSVLGTEVGATTTLHSPA